MGRRHREVVFGIKTLNDGNVGVAKIRGQMWTYVGGSPEATILAAEWTTINIVKRIQWTKGTLGAALMISLSWTVLLSFCIAVSGSNVWRVTGGYTKLGRTAILKIKNRTKSFVSQANVGELQLKAQCLCPRWMDQGPSSRCGSLWESCSASWVVWR